MSWVKCVTCLGLNDGETGLWREAMDFLLENYLITHIRENFGLGAKFEGNAELRSII